MKKITQLFNLNYKNHMNIKVIFAVMSRSLPKD